MLNWNMLRTPEGGRRADDRAKALADLAATDWYVIRALDPYDGRPPPEDVLELRRAARALLSEERDG